MRLDRLIPMLAVTDLERTRAFYETMLGFRCVSEFGPPGHSVWQMLERDGVKLMFNEVSAASVDPKHVEARKFQVYYLYPDDVAALHAKLKSRGAAVSELRVTQYQMKEFDLRDPDNYWFWFGQPTDDAPSLREPE